MTTPKGAYEAVERVRLLHSLHEWFEAKSEGDLDLDKPLPPFCEECSDDDFTSGVEDGWADLSDGGMVPWPCKTLRVLDATADSDPSS